MSDLIKLKAPVRTAASSQAGGTPREARAGGLERSLQTELVTQGAEKLGEPLVLVLGDQDGQEFILLAIEVVLAAEEHDGENELEDRDALAGHLPDEIRRFDGPLEVLGEELAHLGGIAGAKPVEIERIGPGGAAESVGHVLAGDLKDVRREWRTVGGIDRPALLSEVRHGDLEVPVRVACDAVRAVADAPVVLLAG